MEVVKYFIIDKDCISPTIGYEDQTINNLLNNVK
jgi:hypothetical protein